MQLRTWLVEPVLLQGTDSGAVPVLHMESWPPGGSLLWYYRTSLCGHTFLLLSLRCPVQRMLSKHGAPPSGSLPHAESVFQELPLWGGLQPSPISIVTSLSVRKPGIQVFLMILGFNFVFIEPDKIQLSDGSSIMLF